MSILIILLVLIIGVLVYAATRPDDFRVARSKTINAPAKKIFPLINDFHSWTSWSPYEKVDPTMKKTYGGAESGEGAVYEWEGNNKVGKGRMEITDISAPSKIVIKLDFDKPMKAHNIAEFTLKQQGDATIVTWGMTGAHSFIGKLISVFVTMDKLVGKDFEKGLANLQQLSEK